VVASKYTVSKSFNGGGTFKSGDTKYHWYSFVWKSYSYLGVAPLKNGNILE
jgi:hypothetical protein